MQRDRALLMLGGDLMLGRGVDQILAHPGDARLYEAEVKDARAYVALAEEKSGPIPRGAPFEYPWGDALEEIERRAPDARIVDLETTITRSRRFDGHKGVHYRMHPDNVGALQVARIDVCALANDHSLDWGRSGLLDTLQALAHAGVRAAGAGRTLEEAQAPAVVDLRGGGRVLVFAFADASSGVPASWAADRLHAGIDLLPDLSDRTAALIGARMSAHRRDGDVIVASIHWGGHWGDDVPAEHRRFAHRLVEAGADVVHGHSSRHPRAVEVHWERLILYGCGPVLDDAEGVASHEELRPDLVLLFFATVSLRTGALLGLSAAPMRIRGLRLQRPSPEERALLHARLQDSSEPFGARFVLRRDGSIALAAPTAPLEQPGARL